jgi:hypothetical protein
MGVLRKLFGPSRDEIWRALSEAIGANYVEGTFFKAGRVEARHGEWIVTLDTHTVSTGKTTVVYTRVRAPYVNPDGFRFTLYKRGLISDVGKLLGMQDVEIGDPQFDHEYIVKGTDEARLRHLFANPALREMIRRQPQMHLSVKDHEGWFGPKFPGDVDVLTFMVVGVIKDVERLKGLYELFAEVLDTLCRMGSAYETDPAVRL